MNIRTNWDDLLDIAANKMAVVKSGQEVCVSYRQQPEIASLLRSCVGRWRFPQLGGKIFCCGDRCGLGGSSFEYQSRQRKVSFTSLAGSFQAYNAGVAIALAEEVLPGIGDEILQAGLDTARWPGRCQLVAGSPPILLDGAINAESAAYLRELVTREHKPLYFILGVPADKDWQGVIDTLAPEGEAVWLTRASNNTLVFPAAEEALATAEKYNANIRVTEDVGEALAEALAAADSEGAVVVAGTMSLLRDAKIYIQSQLGRDCDE